MTRAPMPVPATPAEATADRCRDVVGAVRTLAAAGLGGDAFDHVAVRDAAEAGCFWVTPPVYDPWSLEVGELEPVGRTGSSRALALPWARPDLVAVVGVWSAPTTAWSLFGLPVAALSQDSCAFHGEHEVVAARSWRADRTAAAWSGKARLLVGRGAVTYGRSVDEAAWWALALDRACAAEIGVRACGAVVTIDAPTAAVTQAQVGTHHGGWFNFQPLRSRTDVR